MSSESLGEMIVPYVEAGFAGLYLLTREPEEAEREVFRACRENDWLCRAWDAAQGVRYLTEGKVEPGKTAPPAALGFQGSQLDGEDQATLVVLHNFHRFLDNPVVSQALTNAVVRGKGEQVVYLVLAPVVKLPEDLEKLFTVIEHPLPPESQLAAIAIRVSEGEVPKAVLDAAKGLTRREAEDAFALSLVKKDHLDPEVVWSMKAQCLRKARGLRLYRPTVRFDTLGGLEGLKRFALDLLNGDPSVLAKGLLLVGPPRTGKSHFCKALGAEIGWPELTFDVGSLFAKYVGETEQYLRSSLATAEAMGKVIIFIDEIGDALSGSGDQDSGVSSRLFGTLLQWMQDREERGGEAFVVAAANDVSHLRSALFAAERFDATFYVDLPGKEERDAIWALYSEEYKVGTLPGLVGISTGPPCDDTLWSGAEIKQCCRLARRMRLPLTEAARHVVPWGVSHAEELQKIRGWASSRCLSAATGEVYRVGEQATVNAGVRKVIRK